MRVYRDIEENGVVRTIAVFDLPEATYTAEDMSKRMITAKIQFPTPIDFKIGDYIELPMQSLLRDGNKGTIMDGEVIPPERYYIYTEPQCKKTARSMMAGDAFDITVNFYTRQYELSCVQMRDFVQQEGSAEKIIYTGFDNVTFYGGAHELLERCIGCLNQAYKDPVTGEGLWSYDLNPALNEVENNALERYVFSFQGNSVLDALLKLNDKDYINTTFFINDRTIYVGYKRPFLCSVNNLGAITNKPLQLKYGKTSDKPIDLESGGLFDITKSVGDEVPITRLFAYGAARNLNRYYCADRIHSGRFVNKLMLPSFSDDGETDWIISEDGVKKYGIREGSKNFDEIYPSLRYMTYADIRGIKYCIKVKTSGLDSDVFEDGKMDHTNIAERSQIPLARVQCYKVTPCTGQTDPVTGKVDGEVGVNKLVECAPPDDLAVFIHATGKTVKVILYGGPDNTTAITKQLQHDKKIPTTDGVTPSIGGDYSHVHPGSCFCVHDNGFADMDGTTHRSEEREAWFDADFRRYDDSDPYIAEDINQQEAELHRIEYVDTFWLTDLYVMEYENGAAKYDDQRNFPRDGYSAWAWPRLNSDSNYPDSLPVNEVVAVEPINIADTSANINGGRQQHWDIYLRDLGFAIDEQNDFGEMVFVFSTPVVSVLDGILAGREFTIDGGDSINDFQDRVVCAYNEDGTFNQAFLEAGDSKIAIASDAYRNGAIWRVRLNRNGDDKELSSIGLVIPNVDIQMKGGDHVVLLDIYMPDIYVRAAEQRLLREARNFLDKNDRGNVKYSINLDQVRFNQIANYALQMREGLVLRMIDEDLNIRSTNKERWLVNHNIPLETSVPMYSLNRTTNSKNIETTYGYGTRARPGSGSGRGKFSKDAIIDYDNQEEVLELRIPRAEKTSAFGDLWLNPTGATFGTHMNVRAYEAIDDNFWYVKVDCDIALYRTIITSSGVDVIIDETIIEVIEEKIYPSQGDEIWVINKEYINFKSGKFYEAKLQVRDAHWDEQNSAILLTNSPIDIVEHFEIDDYTCEPEQTVEDGWRTVVYSFYLEDSFNDSHGYYVALKYFATAVQENYSAVRIVSVKEKDLNSDGDEVLYVDFKVQNLTIKINDNTRPSAEDNTEYADESNKMERVIDFPPERIYTITAQIEEQTKATSWGILSNQVEKNKIEQEQTKRTYEMIINVARQNYQQLLNLKTSLFDPDGNCNQVFLQSMMMQVGADSMNYQLDNTFTTPTGLMNNFTVEGRDTEHDLNDYFRVFNSDILRHFVYTQGVGNGGTWVIPGNFDAELEPAQDEQGNTIWPTYYVCIRCRKDAANDETEPAWICSTHQYAVNQATDPDTEADTSQYWFFNWGILTADSNGHYSLMETRGNAYMYGDNIIAGKISSLAGHCYYDLTHGDFVLSKTGPNPTTGEYSEGMTYIDGKLTIFGLNDEEGIGKAIKDLQLEEIGGENLYGGVDPLRLSGRKYTGIVLENGKKYVITIGDITGNAGNLLAIEKTGDITYNDLATFITRPTGDPTVTYKDKSVMVTGTGKELGFRCNANSGNSWTLTGIMVQQGTKGTTYSTYYHHLTDALKGSTEVVGGLVMTNLLMLKDLGDANNAPKVVAGMSGLPDDGPHVIEIEGTPTTFQSEGVTMWGGGNYDQALMQAMGYVRSLQDIIPILITKTGARSRIGCFVVQDANTVYVENPTQTEKITINTTNGITISKRATANDPYVDKVRISGNEINPVSILGESVGGRYEVKKSFVNDGTSPIANYEQVLAQLDLTGAAGNWVVNCKANYVIFTLNYNLASSLAWDNAKLYIGSQLVAQYGSFSNNNPPQGRVQYVMPITNFQSMASGQYDVKFVATNVRCTASMIGGGVGLIDVKLVERVNNVDTESEINFTNGSINEIIEIGCNGIQVSHSDGGFVQMLNDGHDLYMKMFGLPRTQPSEEGRLYNRNGFVMLGGESTRKMDLSEIFDKIIMPPHVRIPNIPIDSDPRENDEVYRNGLGSYDLVIGAPGQY